MVSYMKRSTCSHRLGIMSPRACFVAYDAPFMASSKLHMLDFSALHLWSLRLVCAYFVSWSYSSFFLEKRPGKLHLIILRRKSNQGLKKARYKRPLTGARNTHIAREVPRTQPRGLLGKKCLLPLLFPIDAYLLLYVDDMIITGDDLEYTTFLLRHILMKSFSCLTCLTLVLFVIFLG